MNIKDTQPVIRQNMHSKAWGKLNGSRRASKIRKYVTRKYASKFLQKQQIKQ